MDEEQALEVEEVETGGAVLARAPKTIEGQFRKTELPVPAGIQNAPGIKLFGRVIRSFVFSTDIAVIRNCDADAVLAVYPFTCQPAITQALLSISERPVFTGVAGKVTAGMRSVELAMQSEMQGASGVVVNTAARPDLIENIARSVDIPVVVSVSTLDERVVEQITAGATIVNVTAGKDTARLVKDIRNLYPELPLIASGGNTDESVAATIAAGADAISWTPPSVAELQKETMRKNRAAHAEAAGLQPEDETEEMREARLLRAAIKAAQALDDIDAERRREFINERSEQMDGLFSSRLNSDDRQLFRDLLIKLFSPPEPGTDSVEVFQNDDAD